MKNCNLKIYFWLVFAVFPFLISCGENTKSEPPTAYYKIQTAFSGSFQEKDIKPLLESVLKKYKLELTDSNLEKTASMLISLRKDSKVGVTEMDILKHMYQNGNGNVTIQEQAAFSATELEMTK